MDIYYVNIDIHKIFAIIYSTEMDICGSLEVFSQMSAKDVNDIYIELKKATKKVSNRQLLESRIKEIVKIISLLKWHLGLDNNDTEKDMSTLKVIELRDIHRTMRQTLIGARTLKQKKQKIARMIKITDYFLQF